MSAAQKFIPDSTFFPRVPKLRSSCDCCGEAKINCNSGQPECHRCIALGLNCVYGLSRKFGKPPRKRLLDRADSSSPQKRNAETTETCEDQTVLVFEQSQGTKEPAQLSFAPISDMLSMPSNINPAPKVFHQNQLLIFCCAYVTR